jgi:hypothetical protein
MTTWKEYDTKDRRCVMAWKQLWPNRGIAFDYLDQIRESMKTYGVDVLLEIRTHHPPNTTAE